MAFTGVAQGPGMPRYSSGIGRLEQERKKALDRLESLRTYYDRPDAAQLLQQLQGQASGQDAPFTPDVIGQLLGANSDSAAGQASNEQDLIRQRMSNAGLSGSGIETSAMITSRRRAQAQARVGRREITSRAALENYQAKERAMSRVQQYLAERQQAEQTAGLAETDFRSRMQAVEPDPIGGQVETNPRMGGGGGFAPAEPDEAPEPFTPTWQPPTPRAPAGPPPAESYLPFQGGTSRTPNVQDFLSLGAEPAPQQMTMTVTRGGRRMAPNGSPVQRGTGTLGRRA